MCYITSQASQVSAPVTITDTFLLLYADVPNLSLRGIFLSLVMGGCVYCVRVWGGEGWLAFHVKLMFYLSLEAIPRAVMHLYFLLGVLSSFTLSPSHNLWLLCSQCHCWWFVTLVAKEGKRLLLFSQRACLVKAGGCVALFSELGFMYILLNSPKASRHQGLENEKWLLLLPYFAQDPEPPHVSDFPARLQALPSLAMSWKPRRAVYSFYNNHRGMRGPEKNATLYKFL